MVNLDEDRVEFIFIFYLVVCLILPEDYYRAPIVLM